MVKRNPNFSRLSKRYLFQQEIDKTNVIDLSIGDTSEPLSTTIVDALVAKSKSLGLADGYEGYGPAFGIEPLREKIATNYKGLICPDEIFISDGAKCDVGRLALLYTPEIVALQNPAYPVYRDTSLLLGCREIIDLPCTPENNFFPTKLPYADMIYLCSPNNPTGTVLTRSQLEACVAHAKKCDARIIFDAAYASYIQDPTYPRSIYEIEGADEVAIEINSLSKSSGFTSLRLGWSIVPKKLPEYDDWKRICSTFFNGASCLSQAAALAARDEHIEHYLNNAALLRNALTPIAKNIYGGIHAPFLWVDFGEDMWEYFLKERQILTTPGRGFGSCGERFLRFSAFGSRATIEEACRRCHTLLSPSLT